MKNIWLAALGLLCLQAIAQVNVPVNGSIPTPGDTINAPMTRGEWYQSFQLRGYVQARYNRLFETNNNLRCEQCDRSWGGDGGFFLRRIRLIFFGQINERVYFYIQPDFASNATSEGMHYGQLRDAYFDLGLDSKNEFRFRVGQSKVPFGFENMQSSQNRLPLDRNDALNSAVSNERDLGVFFYYAPANKRILYSELARKGLKTSGDYGILGLGVYNGQTANKPEINQNKHVVARLTYPFEIGDQIIEPGIQGYKGVYRLYESQISPGVEFSPDRNYIDERMAMTFVLYPKPFGIQAEYNVGRGPEFNPETNTIETQDLHGGYLQFSYYRFYRNQLFIPFMRAQHYSGGKKHERDARSYDVEELELGVEWQPNRNFELVAMYTISSRRFEDFQNPINLQAGRLLRLQAQINF